MKTRYTFHTVLLIALLLGGLFHFSACTSDSKRAETQISVSTPPRPAGQTDVVGLTCEPIETVRIGFIGLGAPPADTFLSTFLLSENCMRFCMTSLYFFILLRAYWQSAIQVRM